MDGGDVSDMESVSHVSNTFSDSEGSDSFFKGEGFGVTPSDNEMDEICRNLTPYDDNDMDETLFNEILEPAPIVEEEDFDLYPPEEEAYRSNNWKEACLWCASDEMFERVAYNVTPYFVPILNLGKDTPKAPSRLSFWDGGELEECDRIADILKFRPREGCKRDQMRVEYVKGWVSHLRDGDRLIKGKINRDCYAKFRLYDGSSTIRVRLWNDTKTHKAITTGVLREGCVVVLYHVVAFVDMETTPGKPRHRLSAGFSNVLALFG